MSRASYSVRGFGRMMADRVRMDAYEAALARAIGPDSVVLDVGTGTGVMALIACRLGARRVIAVEPDDAIHLAREAARANGVADRIEFIQGLSTRVQLPERADVVVSDLRGVLPLAYPHIPAIMDVRARHLAPGGVLIPAADTLWAAPVHAPEEHRRLTAPWLEHAGGMDLSAPLRAALDDWEKLRFTPERLVAPAQRWGVLDYATVASPHLRGTLGWTVERAATAHGLAVWFDALLAEGIGFTTGPHGPPTIYENAFFSWPRAVALAPGDAISVQLTAHLVGEEYVWGWETRIERTDGSRVEFAQSTLAARLPAAEALPARAHGHRPALDEEGRVTLAILEMMDGSATLGEIAERLRERFPGRFAGWEQALARVGTVSEQHSR